jgi:hypothetical protein
MIFNNIKVDIENLKNGVSFSGPENLIRALKTCLDLVHLAVKPNKKNMIFKAILSKGQIEIILQDKDNLSFEGMDEGRGEAIVKKITVLHDNYEEYKEKIINRDVDSAAKLDIDNGCGLSKYHEIMKNIEAKIKVDESGQEFILAKVEKIDTKVTVKDDAKILNCIITSIRNDDCIVTAEFQGKKENKTCIAVMTINTDCESVIHQYMKERQRVNISVVYDKGIKPKVIKIKGELLEMSKASTQTGFIDV